MKLTAWAVLQWSREPSIYYGLWESLFTRWTGSATATPTLTKSKWKCSTKASQTYTMATNPHECAVYCINLLSSKLSLSFQSKTPNQFHSDIIVLLLIWFHSPNRRKKNEKKRKATKVKRDKESRENIVKEKWNVLECRM